MVGKLITHVTLVVSMLVSATRFCRRGDAVLVVTNPPLLPFVMALGCAFKRSKCILPTGPYVLLKSEKMQASGSRKAFAEEEK